MKIRIVIECDINDASSLTAIAWEGNESNEIGISVANAERVIEIVEVE